LPAAIARMAGRPKTTRIREILKTHRESIQQQATDRPSKH
jgi:hypothetical protein